jgi:hypothetical protein
MMELVPGRLLAVVKPTDPTSMRPRADVAAAARRAGGSRARTVCSPLHRCRLLLRETEANLHRVVESVENRCVLHLAALPHLII